MAPSRASHLQVWIRWRKMQIPTRWGWRAAHQKIKENNVKLYNWVVCLKIPIRASLFYGKRGNWDQITPSNSWRRVAPHQKFGKSRFHREEFFLSVNFMSAIRPLPDLRRGHKRKFCIKKRGRVEYTFIQNRFHPLTLSSKHDFIQWHLHPKTVSSNDTFVQNTFIQFWHFYPMTLSSKTLSSNNNFIQWISHPMTVSSNDIFHQ